jgi:hypothetical protein
MRHNDHRTTHLLTKIDILHDRPGNEYWLFSAGSVRKWSKFGLEERKAALEAWGRYVEGLVRPTPANVGGQPFDNKAGEWGRFQHVCNQGDKVHFDLEIVVLSSSQ